MQVFISNELLNYANLEIFCITNGIPLIARSLLRFEPLPYVTPETDIIFFGSPRSYEFAKKSIQNGVLLACIGPNTARLISEKVDWIGNSPGDPLQTAQEFKLWAGTRKVFFPQSDRSIKTISSALPSEQSIQREVYKTILSPQPIPESSVYVFTSPSNFDSFLLCNVLPQNSKLIAWGKSTQQAIEQKGCAVFHTLVKEHENELIEVLNANIGSW